jgi:hypothetical protein
MKDHYKEYAQELIKRIPQSHTKQIIDRFVDIFHNITYAPFAQYIIDHYDINVNSIDSTGRSLHEKAIIHDRVDLHMMLLRNPHINIQRILTKCIHLTRNETSFYDFLSKHIKHYSAYEHARYIMNVHHLRSMLNKCVHKDTNETVFPEDISRLIASFIEPSYTIPYLKKDNIQ